MKDHCAQGFFLFTDLYDHVMLICMYMYLSIHVLFSGFNYFNLACTMYIL